MRTILTFPSTVEASIAFLVEAKKWGQKVIGASSVENDSNKTKFDAWEKLPYIHESEFLDALKQIISNHGITSIYTPHAPSFFKIQSILSEINNIELIGISPYEYQMEIVNSSRKLAADSLYTIQKLSEQIQPIREDFLASLLKYALPMYGECSKEKILALCAIFANAPKGDVVEIGTFFGKSFYVLNRLATHFEIGPSLAIDPWSLEDSIQKDSPSTIQELSRVWKWDEVFQGFLQTTQAVCAQPLNYLRQTSKIAYKIFINSNPISSIEFGNTTYSKRISVLHLDGNHDELDIQSDLELWGKLVVPGGWIVFDDYTWSQGDGPKKVVDRFLVSDRDNIAKFFVAGGAAFVQKKEK